MSFDILVISRPSLDTYDPLTCYMMAGEGEIATLSPDPKLIELYQSITRYHPDLPDCDDEDESPNESPWAISIEHSDRHALFSLKHSIEEVGFLIQDTADDLGLVVYDPQAGIIVEAL